ncbi:MAG TPA: hypothetical protein ENK31_02475, partial [Nannocystis exedens]|nr:hypothetical protein [Nannocystis exedens]
EIRLPLETTISSLDPAAANDAVSQRVSGQIFDTLLDWEPSASPPRLIGEVSLLPELDADRKTLTLRLPSGDAARKFAPDACLKGQDAKNKGRAVRASDAALSLLRHADPHLAGAWDLLAGRILGFDEWRSQAQSSRPPMPAGIIVDDRAGTLTLRLTRAQPELPAILANPRLAIVPPECVAYYDGHDDLHPPFARHPVGSGPYMLDHARSELPRAAILIANPVAPTTAMPKPTSGALRCTHQPGIGRVILEHYASSEAALRLFQTGTIAAFAPGQGLFEEVIRDGSLIPGQTPEDTVIHRASVLATTLLVFRMTDPQLGQSDDPAIDAAHRRERQAIAAAFDDRRYHRIIRNDAWAKPASQVTPRSLLDPGPSVVLHPSAAADRTKPPARSSPQTSLRYMTTTGPAAQQEAAILREALRPIGYVLEVIYDDLYLYKILSGQARAQLFSLRFDADFPDSASFLDPFTCDSSGSYSGFCSPAYDALHRRFAATAPGAERDALALDLERILGAQVPVRPIDTPELWMLTRGWLKNVVRHPLSGLRIELLCVDHD